MAEHETEYSEQSFWDKLKGYAIAAGREVVEKALTLYYCHRDADTPAWARRVIVGALAYFILPTDAIPDLIPGAGYTDDLGALAMALTILAAHVKQEHVRQARVTLERWFSDASASS
jgi:uncharacterized membrane protein YkvA (DUF1232 family)